jgi:hypothetical protein
MKNKIMIIIAGLIITSVLYVYVSGNKFRGRVEQEVQQISRVDRSAVRTYTAADLKQLPAPVQRYFRYALKDGQKHVGRVSIGMNGTFKMKESDQWIPFEAKQYYETSKPAYVWLATLRPLPYLWTEARDLLHQGRGSSVNRLYSALELSYDAGREADLSALARYITEAPWYPTALLPSEFVSWHAVDSGSAKVVFRYNGYIVSVIFTMNGRGEIVKAMTGDRYRKVKGYREQVPWTAHYIKYEEVNRMKIPMEVETAWNLKDRSFVYAKYSVASISYDEK